MSVSNFKGISKEAKEAIIAERRHQIEQQKVLQKQRIAKDTASSQAQAAAAAQLQKDLLKVTIFS